MATNIDVSLLKGGAPDPVSGAVKKSVDPNNTHASFVHYSTTSPIHHAATLLHHSIPPPPLTLSLWMELLGEILIIFCLIVVIKFCVSGIVRNYRVMLCQKQFRQGLLLSNRHHEAEALVVLDQIIRQFGQSKDEVLKEYMAKIFVKKGDIALSIHRKEEAIAAFQAVIDRFSTDQTPSLRQWVKKAQQQLDPDSTVTAQPEK